MAFPGQPPPLTPVLLAGLAVRPLPRLSELAAFAPFSDGFYRGREGAAPIGADPPRAAWMGRAE